MDLIRWKTSHCIFYPSSDRCKCHKISLFNHNTFSH